MSEEKRRHARLRIHLPIQAQVHGDMHVLDVADISPSGMQIQSRDFEKLKSGFDVNRNRADFEIEIVARLAWVQNAPNGDFVTGWEFEGERDVPRIG